MQIRRATEADHEVIWAMLEPVFRAGETYAIDRDIDRAAALAYWFAPGHVVWLALDEAGAAGTYFLCPNQGGGGAHVANCGFVTSGEVQGRGVARAMIDHALGKARGAGFRAMQFNFVVSTNARAVALWKAYGFAVVGRLPGAFLHPDEGYVDALVMYRTL